MQGRLHCHKYVGATILFVTVLIAGCITPRGTYLDPETGLLVAEAPEDDSMVCKYEAPSGSNIRQRVCYRNLDEQGRADNLAHAMEQLETVGRRPPPTSGPTPAPGQQGP